MSEAIELTEAELLEAFEYLDELRESGDTNMFGAAAFIVAGLGWPRHEASQALKLWMRTFDREKSAEDRARTALTTAMEGEKA